MLIAEKDEKKENYEKASPACVSITVLASGDHEKKENYENLKINFRFSHRRLSLRFAQLRRCGDCGRQKAAATLSLMQKNHRNYCRLRSLI
jgi:hypothetical protein